MLLHTASAVIVAVAGLAAANPFNQQQKSFLTEQDNVNGLPFGDKPSPAEAAAFATRPSQVPWPGSGPEDYYGIRTFAHTKPVRCMGADKDVLFDVAVLGAPFDTATSWRPGARFGPAGIRGGSQRLGGPNKLLGNAPFQELSVVDCGDSKMPFFLGNAVALDVLEKDYKTLIDRAPATKAKKGEKSIAQDGAFHPRVVMLGGDHTIVLPALRALHAAYGKISVIHFDAHVDTSDRLKAEPWHGDYFWHAYREGLLTDTSIHAGIRSYWNETADNAVGFTVVTGDEILDIGWKGVIERIRDRVGDSPVYLTIDIDTLDPAFAPATGTPEPGGWTSREMIKILHGLKDLKIIGADVVEVAPAYDDQAETTQIVAASMVFELISMMALTPLTA